MTSKLENIEKKRQRYTGPWPPKLPKQPFYNFSGSKVASAASQMVFLTPGEVYIKHTHGIHPPFPSQPM